MQRSHCAQEGEKQLDLEKPILAESMVGDRGIITHIRATDVAVGLRRIPIGFYVETKIENVTRKTLIKPLSVREDVVEWDDEIVLPADRSSTISLRAIASFELGPPLGDGEVFGEFEATVGELLDCNGRFEFIESLEEGDGEVISSPSSFEIKIEKRPYDSAAPYHPSDSTETSPLAELTDKGHTALIRYRELRERSYLDESIIHFEHARDLSPLDHSSRASVLFNLAAAKLMYCQINDVDLDEPIALYQDALHLRPRGHPDHPFTLLSLGIAIKARFQRQSGELDAADGDTLLSQVLDAAPPDSYTYHAAVLALGITAKSELIRPTEVFQSVDDDLSEDGVVQRLDTALRWLFHPYSFCDEHTMLDPLGVLFCLKFDTVGDLADPEKAISMLEVIVQFTSDDHPAKPSWLDDLGSLLLTRYEDSGDTSDLEKSISMLEIAVKLTPDDHPDKPLWLDSLTRSLSIRYKHHNNITDLDKMIRVRGDMVKLTPDGHPDKPLWQNNLGYSFSIRYDRLGDDADLENMVSSLEEAVRSAPDGHPDKPLWSTNLASSLLARYEQFGDVRIIDLQESISILETVVQSTVNDDPDKSGRLDELAHSLLTRYERFGDAADLEKSISLRKAVIESTPDGDPNKPASMCNLGRSLLSRYENLGSVVDLSRAISMFEGGIQSAPDDHPNKPLWRSSLGAALSARFARFGDTTDLERSISLSKEVMQVAPDGNPSKPLLLNNLGESLLTRYKRFGDVSDLTSSISLIEDALKSAPDRHPNKPSWLNNLGYSLSARYERFGDVQDLERSVSIREDTLRLTPDDHADRPLRLNGLGDSLLLRYELFGDVADLEESISLFEHAVQSTPDGQLYKPFQLASLSHSLLIRYRRFKDDNDLERSISIRRDAVESTPDSDPNKPLQLTNLGRSFLARFDSFEDATDLTKAISMFERALELTPGGHPNKPSRLSNLAHSLSTRYKRFGNAVDLEKSLSLFEDVVQSLPDGHPDKPSRLTSLARSLLDRVQRSGDLSGPDLPRAISYSSQATRSQIGPSLDRFQASQVWIQCIRLLHPSNEAQALLDAYTIAIDLLPQLAWVGLSLHDRYHQLLQAADGTCDAAAAALEAHKPELAVEWLEQGRAVMWTQLSQLRTPVDDLRAVYPELAARFEHISHELEHASARDRISFDKPTTKHLDMVDDVLEKQAGHHHALALSREKLLEEIRALPGFERFLLPKTVVQLSSLVNSGPVVFLNASKHRCDALIVMAGPERVVHVPLPNARYDEVKSMHLRLSKLLKLHGRVILRDSLDRGARVKGLAPDDVFGSILTYLWNKVVSPILETLAFSTSQPDRKLPRVFWCPTGPFTFLPIHAAGLYDGANSGPKLSDFAISSYIPTMSALELPASKDPNTTSNNVRLLAVPQPSTDGQVHLSGVSKEMEVVRELTSSSPFVELQVADGTVEDVLEKMTKTDWVHFACHGTQDRADPLNSGLLLADGKRLRLSDIVRLSSRPYGGLAFLSACQTATGDEQLSEEAIHLAAGMLLAGYRSVVATTWSISDSDAPRVAKDVYASLVRDGDNVPDSRQAAEALHCAIQRLRDSGAAFLSWVPFIHVGL